MPLYKAAPGAYLSSIDAPVRRLQMQPVDLTKHRDIVFDALPPEQTQQAARLLGRLAGVTCAVFLTERRVHVSYTLPFWTLETLEQRLLEAGFHLDGSLLQRLRRALVHYTESVQMENLHHPEREYKTKEVYVHAWEQHPHGDHDDTPEELREYR